MSEQIYQYLLDNTKFELPLDIVAGRRRRSAAAIRQSAVARAEPPADRRADGTTPGGSEEQARQQLKTFFIMTRSPRSSRSTSAKRRSTATSPCGAPAGQRPEKLKEQMERDGSLAQFRLEVRQEKCISKLLEAAHVDEQSPRAGEEEQIDKEEVYGRTRRRRGA